jgi:hypothetical protein
VDMFRAILEVEKLGKFEQKINNTPKIGKGN